MEPLPYFLALMKNNVLLWSIIMHGSFSQLDLNKVEYTIHSKNFISLQEFYLDENKKFPSVDILMLDEETLLTFYTDNSEYYEHPERYFQRVEVERSGNPYIMFGQQARTWRKRIGKFELAGSPNLIALIYVVKSNIYGYAIIFTVTHDKEGKQEQ